MNLQIKGKIEEIYQAEKETEYGTKKLTVITINGEKISTFKKFEGYKEGDYVWVQYKFSKDNKFKNIVNIMKGNELAEESKETKKPQERPSQEYWDAKDRKWALGRAMEVYVQILANRGVTSLGEEWENDFKIITKMADQLENDVAQALGK